MQVFISYRRSDSQGSSRLLADALKRKFGDEAVFFDTNDLSVGVEWRAELQRRLHASTVVLAVIGPTWAMTATDRAHRVTLDHTETDVVRMEIELAYQLGVSVIPVLVDGAQMPARAALLRPFKPLAETQGHTLRHEAWDRDLEALTGALETVAPAAAPPAPATNGAAPAARNGIDRVARYLHQDNLVTVLGRGVEAAVPDAAELARTIASEYEIAGETSDLAWVAQRVLLSDGRVDLCERLSELVGEEREASPVHEFLARLPSLLSPAHADVGHLVITTGYDNALERALDAAHTPYDLAVFMASGEYTGKFAHVPWWQPDVPSFIPVTVPNQYIGFPFDEDCGLQRTLIVKAHGGTADFGPDGPDVRDNFVVTEDDYIAYLTRAPIESVLPPQILDKLRSSHFLFLGYPMLEWPVRVLLQRVFSGQRLGARSWAVAEQPSDAEKQLWDELGVKVVEQAPADYVVELQQALESRTGTP